MDFRFSETEEAFRQEVRAWLKENLPNKWVEEGHGNWDEGDDSAAIFREFQRKLGQKGWLAPTYPKKYGGAELNLIEALILSQEISEYRIAVELTGGVNWAGGTISIFGTEEQKNKYLTGLARGEMLFCLGYSEPNSGSDLASLQTKAEEVADGYIINGQKIWTTLGHLADYMWLAARTDPDASSKHRGISLFILDMKSPGVTVRPLVNINQKHHFNEVFLDNVRISKECLVGEKNRGWYQLAGAALQYERIWLSGGGRGVDHSIRELVEYVKHTKRGRNLLADNPVIRQELAELAIENEVVSLMSERLVGMASKGVAPAPAQTSSAFLAKTRLTKRIANTGMLILGLYGLLERGSKWADLGAWIEEQYLTAIADGIGGGTAEIQKNIIATRGLELPNL